MKCKNLIDAFEDVSENRASITISILFKYVAQKSEISYNELKVPRHDYHQIQIRSNINDNVNRKCLEWFYIY